MEQQLKLSEAIRKGSELRPMCRNHYFAIVNAKRDILGSCVLGAAYEAITGETSVERMIETIERATGSNLFCESFVRDYQGQPQTLGCVILDMNDSGKFTREEISDWLESIGE